jgi:hypothetical protein
LFLGISAFFNPFDEDISFVVPERFHRLVVRLLTAAYD